MTLSSSRTLPFQGSDMNSFSSVASTPLKRFLQLAVVQADEVLDQRRDVLAALAQRRDLDAEDVEAVVEVVAEAAGLDLAAQVAVGGGDDAHVDLDRRRGADRQDLLGLDGAQQLDLQAERQVADLVEEDRAAPGALEQPFLVADGAGERAAQVAEELALEQVLGDGAAVDRQEDRVAPVAEVVDGARHDLLADAALAGDQHRARHRRDALDQRHHLAHRRRLADQVLEVPLALDLAAQELALPGELPVLDAAPSILCSRSSKITGLSR